LPAVVFMPAAIGEARDARDWYAKESRELGRRFRVELGVATQRIALQPLA
jgi:hypothetical protein